MRNVSTFTLCALCAVPALVQTASAQESAKVEQFGEMMGAAMDITAEFIGALQAVDSEEATAAEAAAAINVMADNAAKLSAEMQQLVASMSPEEQEELGKAMQDPEVVELMKQLEEMSTAIKAKLAEVKHYDSPELKAACDKFFAATN